MSCLQRFLEILLLPLFILACAQPHDSKAPSETPAPVNPAADLMNAGGSPGRVWLSSGWARRDQDRLVLDDRVSVVLRTGLSLDKKATSLESDSKFISLEAADKVTTEDRGEKFLNIGCDSNWVANHSPVDTKQRQAVKMTDFTGTQIKILASDLIFLCNTDINFDSTLILAPTIVLNNATLKIQGSGTAFLTLTTNDLFLVGENSIRSQGVDDSWPVMAAPQIVLSSVGQIHGDGKLVIESTGGNNIVK